MVRPPAFEHDRRLTTEETFMSTPKFHRRAPGGRAARRTDDVRLGRRGGRLVLIGLAATLALVFAAGIAAYAPGGALRSPDRLTVTPPGTKGPNRCNTPAAKHNKHCLALAAAAKAKAAKAKAAKAKAAKAKAAKEKAAKEKAAKAKADAQKKKGKKGKP
jgi:hypothetical protein